MTVADQRQQDGTPYHAVSRDAGRDGDQVADMSSTISSIPSAEPPTPAGVVASLAPASTPERGGAGSSGDDTTRHQWQARLLPLMSRMIVGLTLFFFAASLAQLIYLDRSIERVPVTDLARLGIVPPAAAQPAASAEFRILASLDAALLGRRYHQANVFLMGRLWTSYLGFVTGMILALVGAVFILGKLREDVSEVSGTGAPGSVALRSSSPGIILAVLGVVLMITTIVTNHPIRTADAPVYIGASTKPDVGGPYPTDSQP